MAHVPLLWMLKEAHQRGLMLKSEPDDLPDTFKTIQSGQDKDGRMYDSRAGLGGYYRYGPRKLADLCIVRGNPLQDIRNTHNVRQVMVRGQIYDAPKLLESVKGYASHERETFEKVTQARAAAMQAQGPEQASQAESQLTAALGGLRVVAEQYPQLRATENFQQLQRQLSELEDEIQASRRIYNSNVQAYNTKIQVFPNSVVAGMGGFTAREFFEIEDPAQREPVAVSFTQPPPATA